MKILRNLLLAAAVIVVSLPAWAQIGGNGISGPSPANSGMLPSAANAQLPAAPKGILANTTVSLYPAQAYAGAISGAPCTWDATHDVGDCVNAARAAAVSNGGGIVILPTGVYGLSTKISNNNPTVIIQCQEYPSESGGIGTPTTTTTGCELKPISSMTTMAEAVVSSGALLNVGYRGIRFNGNGLATNGLITASTVSSHFDDLAFTGAFNGGIIFGMTPAAATGAGPQNNTIANLYVNTTGASVGLKLGAFVDGAGVHGNAAYNVITNYLIGTSGIGILCEGCDNNYFGWGRVFDNGDSVDLTIAQFIALSTTANTHTNTTLDTLGSNVGIQVGQTILGTGIPSGTTVSSCTPNCTSPTSVTMSHAATATGSISVSFQNLFPANGNFFLELQASGSINARGTTSFPACVPFLTCAYANYVYADQTNATPLPIIETGADLQGGSNFGLVYGQSDLGDGAHPSRFSANSYSIWPSCRANSLANAPAGNYYICNSTGSKMLTFDNIQGDVFDINFVGSAGAASLQFSHPTGTGSFAFSGNLVAVGTPTFTTGASGTGLAMGLGRASVEGFAAIASSPGQFSNSAVAGDLVLRSNAGTTWVQSGSGNAGIGVKGTDIIAPSLPTSCAGKSTGVLWSNVGILSVCP